MQKNNNLKGKDIVINVGEPWKFVSPAGKNRLIGKVIMVLSKKSGKDALVLKSKHKITINGMSGYYFIAFSRHLNDTLRSIMDGKKIHVNIGIIENYKKSLTLKELEKSAVFVIVGAVSLVDH